MKKFEILTLLILTVSFIIFLAHSVITTSTKTDTNIKKIEIGNLNNNYFESIEIEITDKITFTYRNKGKSFSKILNNEEFEELEKKISEYSSIVLEEQTSFNVENDENRLFEFYIKLSNNKEIYAEGTNRKPTNFDKFFNSLLETINE